MGLFQGRHQCKVTLEQELEGGAGVDHADILRKNILQRDDSRGKGLGAEACLVCPRPNKMARMAWAEEAKENNGHR